MRTIGTVLDDSSRSPHGQLFPFCRDTDVACIERTPVLAVVHQVRESDDEADLALFRHSRGRDVLAMSRDDPKLKNRADIVSASALGRSKGLFPFVMPSP